MTRWKDPELQAKLAQLSARGLSAGQIAAGIGDGTTRAAVASAMSRNGLFARPKKRRTIANGGPDGAAGSNGG